ncbi:hypothetical protein [Qipengyuania sp. DGS5-3]|uniref:hypothetical protein n=1 Tax=Qipengyuania sp. DGS5-3 TaxID=3349632 RepID=UPI0036D2FE92
MSSIRFSEPFFVRSGRRLVDSDKRHFFLTAAEGSESDQLLVNVLRSGRAELNWVLDHDGRFFEMASLGLSPKTFLQKIGFARQKEPLKVKPPRSITVAEFISKISDIDDSEEDAPIATFAREQLKDVPGSHVIDRETMIVLLGERP